MEKGVGAGGVAAVGEGYAALADGRVVLRKAEEGASIAKLGRAGDRQGDESYLRVAGLGELGGLHDVFASDELGGELLGEVQGVDGSRGGLAVGRVEVVGDGDLGNAGVGEGGERERLGGRILACPKDEQAASVEGGGGGGEVRLGKLLGMGAIGGEEEIFRSTVLELLREGRGGAEGRNDVDASLLFVLGGEGGEDGLEVGGGGDVELVWATLGQSARSMTQEGECEGEEKAADYGWVRAGGSQATVVWTRP